MNIVIISSPLQSGFMLHETFMTSDFAQAATFFIIPSSHSGHPSPLGFPEDGRLRNEIRLAPQCGGVLGDQCGARFALSLPSDRLTGSSAGLDYSTN